MDREMFMSELKQAKADIDSEHIMHVIMSCIESNLNDGNPRGHKNLIIVMEELAELSKEVSKNIRGKGDYYSILEELADVCLGFLFIKEICNISDVDLNKAVNVKAERMEEILHVKGKYD